MLAVQRYEREPETLAPRASDSAPFNLTWAVCHARIVSQHALPAAAAREYGAILVGVQGEVLWIAVPDPAIPGLAASLALAARRPVRLLAAGKAEIVLASAGDRQSGARAIRFRSLIDDLGLSYLLDPRDRALLDGDDGGTRDVAAAVAARLPEGWGPELLGLLDGLPHLSAAATMRAPLRLLLPPALRGSPVQPAMMPWCVEHETLILACAALPSAAVLADIAAWTGLRVRPVLCNPASLRPASAVSHLAPVPHARRRLRGKPASPQRWDLRMGATQRAQVQALARQTGRPAALVAEELALKHRRDEHKLPADPALDALALLPVALCRSLGVLPTRLADGCLEVAIAAETAGEEIAAALAIVAGIPVRTFGVDAGALRAAWATAYSNTQLPPGHRASGYARELASLTGSGEPAPAADDIAEGNRLSRLALEIAAVQAAVPSIRLEQYGGTPLDAHVAPIALLRRCHAVPLRREGEVLWVAFAAPDKDAVAALAQATRLTIRPLLATARAIEARIAVLEAEHLVVVRDSARDGGERSSPITDFLLREGLLSQTALLELPHGDAQPLDELLDARGLLSFVDFAELAARLSGLELFDPQLRSRQEEVVDALGHRGRRVVWDDPIDPMVAALLPADIVHTHGVLPIRRDGDGMVVAVIDPFDPAQPAILVLLGAARIRRTVAPRPAMMSALARARGVTRLGERLLERGVVSADELRQALHVHRSTGVRLGQALVYLNLVSQEQLAYFLAEQYDLGFISPRDMVVDEAIARLLPEEIEREIAALPLYRAGHSLVVATPDPTNQSSLDEVAARTGEAVVPVVCTESDFEALLEDVYRDDYLRQSTSSLIVRSPDESASKVWSRGQLVAIAVFMLCLVLGAWRVPAATGIALTAASGLFYVVFSLFRCYLIYRATSGSLEVPVTPEELAALDESALPIYTILVPLYKEASVLPTLLLGMSRLDYPATKLDVKLLLEEDDLETRRAVEATALPSYVHPVIVPVAQPRGKPKACNYGLIHARGSYVVIFDAEDVPDPDQLKKVVAAFRKSDPAVACMQAKLNYYNSAQNLLTRWFTIEYSMWFDLFLPGLDAAKLPVPLGGTSNHFITSRLRTAGAWDPYNVTEDADLGIRLFRHGWRTAVIDSTTYEEANSEIINWIRQRSRWVKGYAQTFLVHMRHPISLWRALGTRAFLSFLLVVGGTVFGFMLNPILWVLTTLWYLSHAGFIRAIFPLPVFYLGAISLFVGNFAFIYINMSGCIRRGYYDMVRFALTSPLYWALISLAAWKGVLQLFTNPFHWEKTTHGLYKRKAR
jgi:cellulose synthase/poly-beta-1,6-N-acetylglucosamine synthase-like glycosyltransferase